jgi:hypothetical protein
MVQLKWVLCSCSLKPQKDLCGGRGNINNNPKSTLTDYLWEALYKNCIIISKMVFGFAFIEDTPANFGMKKISFWGDTGSFWQSRWQSNVFLLRLRVPQANSYYGYPELWILRYPAHRYHAKWSTAI